MRMKTPARVHLPQQVSHSWLTTEGIWVRQECLTCL
jgi:hypothetical protein